MKNLLKICFIIFFTIYVNNLYSCKSEDEPPSVAKAEKIYYTVIFDSVGGSSIEPQIIESGKTISMPSIPQKTGYTFIGWYDGENKFDFTKAVTKNIKLSAKWDIIHKHVYSNEWTFDENKHWHKAICSHNEEISELSEHIFDDGELTKKSTLENTGIFTYTCKICNYKKNFTVAKAEKHLLVPTSSPVKINEVNQKYRIYKTNYKCTNCGTTCTQYTWGNIGLNNGQWAAISSGLSTTYYNENRNYEIKSKEACPATPIKFIY